MLKESMLRLLLLVALPVSAQELPAAYEGLQQRLELQRRQAAENVSWELPVPPVRFSTLGDEQELGRRPYPGFSRGDLREVRKAIEDGKAAARRGSACDLALAGHGVPSLLDLVSQYVPEGAGAQIFDGRSSTLKPAGWKRDVAATFRAADNNAGAFVLWGGGLPAPVTFLGPYFFSPTSIAWISQQRMIMVLHESVHQFAQRTDAEFGGSKQLSHLIVEKCYPAGRGRLGGID